MSLLNDMLKDLNSNKQGPKTNPLFVSTHKRSFLERIPEISVWLIAPFVCSLLFLTFIYLYHLSSAPVKTHVSAVATHENAPQAIAQFDSVIPGITTTASNDKPMNASTHSEVTPASMVTSTLASAPASSIEPILASAIPVIHFPESNIEISNAGSEIAINTANDDNEEEVVTKVFSKLTDTEWHDEQLNLALKAIQNDNDDQAEIILNRILTRFPKATTARETLANLYLANERLDSAEQTITEGLHFSPHSIPLQTINARIAFEKHHPQQALDILKQYRPDIRKYPDFYGLKAAILHAIGKEGEAGSLYKMLVGIEPSNAQYWLGFAIAMEQNHAKEQAITAYKRVTANYDVDPDIRDFAENRLKRLQG